jgi:acyl-CoA hydrolase
MSVELASVEEAVDFMLERIGGPLRVGAPLGIGKPNRLLNALYARLERDPSRRLELYTALSLDPPTGGSDLEARFLGPFVERHFGADFPRLAYVQAVKRDALPAHIDVVEFYLQTGGLLGSAQAQRRYASLDYTHVARTLAERRMNALVQRVARREGDDRVSLSSNTDLTVDVVEAVAARGLPRPVTVAEVDPELPWLGGSALVEPGFFDAVVTPPGPYPRLFGPARQAVSDAEHAIGLYASALVRDGGTLQIGIGALADAVCHALWLRHTDNGRYREVLAALDPEIAGRPAVVDGGGLDRFDEGLYGCSEMIGEGFQRLVETGVIRRKVVDDQGLMGRMVDGSASQADREALERDGEYLQGAFYLGSPEFYRWLRDMPEEARRRIGMRRVSEVNQLYGGHEGLERLKRRHARFFNSCLMATLMGAAVSDGLEDGRVVSGVGGQYNFVAMGHALPDGRSILMMRAIREASEGPTSNVVWSYGHCTIPRHLRDIYITEYGIADVRGLSDEDCGAAMAAIADARFQPGLIRTAKGNHKLRRDFAPPRAWSRNSPERLRQALARFRVDGTLPDYPLGSDFTDVEQRLVRALGWLKVARRKKLRMLAAAITSRATDDREALARLGLDSPRSPAELLSARLISLALRETS